jgi:TonB family protein
MMQRREGSGPACGRQAPGNSNACVEVVWQGAPPTQAPQPECTKTVRIHGSFPKGSFRTLPGEWYKRRPTVKFLIQDDGTVSDASITYSSGVADIDEKILDAAAKRKYRPQPSGCEVIENEMTAIIHWGRVALKSGTRATGEPVRAKIHLSGLGVNQELNPNIRTKCNHPGVTCSQGLAYL